MKAIFLDIDGVLNCNNGAAQCKNSGGINDDKVQLLAQLVKQTDAKIVLISTWKHYWHKGASQNTQDEMTNYMDEKFKNAGLEIFDKTPDRAENAYLGRGEGIVVYVHNHDVDGFAILDDSQCDYDSCDLTKFWVKTDAAVGLTEKDVEKATMLIKKCGRNR